MRFFLDIEYLGTNFHGWQFQKNTPDTVQQRLEESLEKILRVPTKVYGAGRTDTGVHALKMPAHFDYEGELHPHFKFALNSVLPSDIAATQVYRASNDKVHARFSATYREYRYQIVTRKSPTLQGLAWQSRWKPDFELLQQAAAIFPQYREFGSFCKANAQNKTNTCHISLSEWEQEGDMLYYRVGADRFLRGMVRALVGTMTEIGRGKMKLEELHSILKAQDRRAAGPAVPPDGLFLTEVLYPAGDLIPLDLK